MFSKESPILLVDDSVAMRQTIKNVLIGDGYTDVQSAEDGKDALYKIRAALEQGRMYKLIFLDWNMPEMDGMTFLELCRADLGMKDIAIVMLTAVSDQKSVVKALRSGATSYITKPVSAATLLKKINQVAEWYQTRATA